MNLTSPTDHATAYEWLVVLMAHGGVGIAATAAMAVVLGRGALAWWCVVVVYALAWEGLVQGYGAGLGDAAVDTFGVAAGGLIGWLAWQRRGGLLAVVFVLFSVAGIIGARSRK